MTVKAFCDWLSATSASQWIQSTFWVVPSVQSVHILALSVVLASMLMLDLRMMGLAGKRHSVDDTARRFIPTLWWCLGILLATGAILTVCEPERELMSPAFRWKMLLIVAAGVVTYIVQRVLRREPGFWETTSERRNTARAIAIISLTLWVVIAVLGRWIAYVEPLQS